MGEGERTLEVFPGLAQNGMDLPDGVSKPKQLPFLLQPPRDTLDSGMEGKE